MATNYTGQITTPAAPNTGTPGEEYEQRYFSQTFSNMGNYFQRVTSIIATLFGPRGGKYINVPYGAFQDTTDQTPAANTATLLQLNTTDFSNGVTVVDSTKITVAQPGLYNLQFSVQVENLGNTIQDMSIWLRQNGTDIVGSTGLVGLEARKNATEFYHSIVGWNYPLKLNANDYIQIVFSTNSTNVSIQAYPVGTSPTRPSTASVVATMLFVSNLSTETA